MSQTEPGRLEVLDSPLVQPVLDQSAPNCDIQLASLSASYAEHAKDLHVTRTASVVLGFLPFPRVLIRLAVEPKDALLAMSGSDDGCGTLTLVDRGVTFDVDCDSWDVSMPDATLSLAPRRRFVTATAPSGDIVRSVAHLFSFRRFTGETDFVLESRVPGSPSPATKTLGRVVLEHDGWRITVAEVDLGKDTPPPFAKPPNGFYITHCVEITRADGRAYTSEELGAIIDDLRQFLSFVGGRWAALALPIGFDAGGKRVYEQWGFPPTSVGSGVGSWFDARHGHVLADVFPGFMERMSGQAERSPMGAALYWSLAARDGAPTVRMDAGLVLAQTAIENLAWTVCVKERRMVSPEAFGRRGLSAADRIRLLASALDIPIELPKTLEVLARRRGAQWSDGAHAVTDIRNSLVHPSKQSKHDADGCAEAWEFSLWFLDLALLRLFGYNGPYSNRLNATFVGEVEPVPWAVD